MKFLDTSFFGGCGLRTLLAKCPSFQRVDFGSGTGCLVFQALPSSGAQDSARVAFGGAACRNFRPKPSAHYWRTGMLVTTRRCAPRFLLFMTNSAELRIITCGTNALTTPLQSTGLVHLRERYSTRSRGTIADNLLSSANHIGTRAGVARPRKQGTLE